MFWSKNKIVQFNVVCSLRVKMVFLPPATKLGQGNAFTGVCDSVHMGWGLPQCMLGYPPEQTPPPSTEHAGRYGQRAGGTHPTGTNKAVQAFWTHIPFYCSQTKFGAR